MTLYKLVSGLSFVNKTHTSPGVGVASGMKSELGLEKIGGYVSSQPCHLEWHMKLGAL
jgi:hypothetical protein